MSTTYDFKIPRVIVIASGLVQALKHNVQPQKTTLTEMSSYEKSKLLNFQNKHNFILPHTTFSLKIKILKFR